MNVIHINYKQDSNQNTILRNFDIIDIFIRSLRFFVYVRYVTFQPLQQNLVT